MSLYVRIALETLLQLFNNFQCHTQTDLHVYVYPLYVNKFLN